MAKDNRAPRYKAKQPTSGKRAWDQAVVAERRQNKGHRAPRYSAPGAPRYDHSNAPHGEAARRSSVSRNVAHG